MDESGRKGVKLEKKEKWLRRNGKEEGAGREGENRKREETWRR